MANRATDVKGTLQICTERQDILQECIIQAQHNMCILHDGIREKVGIVLRRNDREGHVQQEKVGERGITHVKSRDEEPSGQQGSAQRSIKN